MAAAPTLAELLHSSAPPGVVGDVFGSGRYASLDVHFDDVLSASNASGVKSGIPVKSRAIACICCPGSVTSGGRASFGSDDVDGGRGGITNDGDARITLAGGGRGGG